MGWSLMGFYGGVDWLCFCFFERAVNYLTSDGALSPQHEIMIFPSPLPLIVTKPPANHAIIRVEFYHAGT